MYSHFQRIVGVSAPAEVNCLLDCPGLNSLLELNSTFYLYERLGWLIVGVWKQEKYDKEEVMIAKSFWDEFCYVSHLQRKKKRSKKLIIEWEE